MVDAAKIYGNVLVAPNPSTSFNLQEMIGPAVQMARHYQEVVLVGASMGARTALEAHAACEAAGIQVRCVVAINGVAGEDSIVESLRKPLSWTLRYDESVRPWLRYFRRFFSVVHAGHHIGSKYLERRRGGRTPVDEGVSRLRYWWSTWLFRLQPWEVRVAQLQYLATLKQLPKGHIRSTPVVYIRSEGDELVKAEAAEAYLDHFSGNGEVIDTELPHCSFVSWEPSWKALLLRVFAKV